MTRRPTRERSTEFHVPVHRKERRRHQYNLDAIPADLWSAVQRKATREGVSLRALLLRYLQEWVETDTTTTTKGRER